MPSKKATPRGLRIRKLADRTGGDEARNDDLPGAPPGTWPLAGIAIEGDPPPLAVIPLAWARRGQAQGWVELENPQTVQRPAGPPDDPTRELHTFTHADAIVLKTAGGYVRYRVTHQPDKYDADNDQAEVTSEAYQAGNTRVDWFYLAELEN